MGESDEWTKEFPITSVTRSDLESAGLSRAVATAVTDDQMRAIARKMADYYVGHGPYWEHVREAVEYVSRAQQQQRPPLQQQARAIPPAPDNKTIS